VPAHYLLKLDEEESFKQCLVFHRTLIDPAVLMSVTVVKKLLALEDFEMKM